MLHLKRGALTGAAWLISLLFCAMSDFIAQRCNPLTVVPRGCVVASLTVVLLVVYRAIKILEALATQDDSDALVA